MAASAREKYILPILDSVFTQIALLAMGINMILTMQGIVDKIYPFMEHYGIFIFFPLVILMDVGSMIIAWRQAYKNNHWGDRVSNLKALVETLGVLVDIAAMAIFYGMDPLNPTLAMPILFTSWLAIKALYKLVLASYLSRDEGRGGTAICIDFKAFFMLALIAIGNGMMKIGVMDAGAYIAITGGVIGLIMTCIIEVQGCFGCLGEEEDASRNSQPVGDDTEGSAAALLRTPPVYEQNRPGPIETSGRVINGDNPKQSPRSSSGAFFTPRSQDSQTRGPTANAEQLGSAAAPVQQPAL